MKPISVLVALAAVAAAAAVLLRDHPAAAQLPVEEYAPNLEACFVNFVTAARSEHGAKLGETYCQRRFPQQYTELMQ